MRIIGAWTMLLGIMIDFFYLSATGTAAEPKLWPSTSLTKVLVSDMPEETTPSILRISGARGEIVSGQAVFSPGETVDAATVSMSDLRRRDSNAKIPASSIELQWVRYIDIQKNSSRIPRDDLEIIAPAPMPDPYWEDETIPVRFGTYAIIDNSIYILYRSQPIWIEIHVPRNAQAGVYAGTLTVTGASKSAELPVELRVWGFEVPKERHLSVIYWWNMPAPGFEHIKPFSEEYWQLLGKFARFVVAHRQTDVGLFSLESFIKETGDGKFDTSLLERCAEVVFKAGIRQIHMHRCGDLSKSDHISAGVGGSVLDRSMQVVPYEPGMRRLPALNEMINRRNWRGRFLVAVHDEPFMHVEESYTAVLELAKKTAPDVRFIDAVEAEYLGKLDVYCPKINHLDMWYDTYKQHQREGAELWFYTSRIPVGRYPTRFIDTSLLKYRVQFWMEYLCDLDGYLHCGLNAFYDSNHYSEKGVGGAGAPVGNNNHTYPGRNGLLGSLRSSTVRDGLEDYEYLWVLEDRLARLKQRIGEDAHWLKPRQRSLELCRRVAWSLHDYTRSQKVMLDTREAIAEEIEALEAEPLLYVQTSPSEGTVFPAGPRNLGIRGLVHPDAKVIINNDLVEDIRPSGYFRRFHFLLDEEPVITITAEHDGKTRTVTRTFKLTD